jgi:hypothetical protein
MKKQDIPVNKDAGASLRFAALIVEGIINTGAFSS